MNAALDGDRHAAEELITAHLPLLYRIVGRALDGHADVDDVVQETVLRAHRDLPALRAPESFRSWLVAIATHQISSRLRSRQQERDRTAALDDAAEIADPDAEFADLTLLRLSLSAQRRQVVEATGWLDPGDRDLAALWWREVAGDLTRAELVAATGLGAAHARVRLQRMRRQLELSRFLVAALDAEPRCPQLDALTDGWNGTPGPRWRKRFARHLRDCDVCGGARAGFVPLERLVLGASLVPLPSSAGALAAATALGSGAAASGTGTSLGAGAAGWIGKAIGVKAVAAVLAAVTASGGTYLVLSDRPAPEPVAIAPLQAPSAVETPAAEPATPTRKSSPAAVAPASPSRSPAPASPGAAGLVPLGPVVIRPAGQPGAAVTLSGDYLVTAAGVSGEVVTAGPGIADRSCVSFRDSDGRYVRHASFRIMLSAQEDRELFRMDATFCPQKGDAAGTVRFRSFNYPDRFIRVAAGELRLDPAESTAAYVAASTFTVSSR
ncbi:sigma-70 family RNA polymerase sigma factor [Winogradskya consettensis]|uniref:sigma-70 family RNA polymerase sigma factor n=1 Tax=Winogradskya consettensis TaxID=113560 RepID=UPI001BB33379|nr:sigma-70 family RNA polymerase sigma factor [Actinoplanes consettensis]